MTHATLPAPLMPDLGALDPAHLALIGFLARYQGKTHDAYTYQLRQWFAWCDRQNLDPLTGPTRAHVELYIRWRQTDLGNTAATIGSVMSPIKGYYKFAVIDGLIGRNPAEYAHVPKIRTDDTRKLGLDRDELMRFLMAGDRLGGRHHGFAYLLGVLALRVTEACSVKVEDYADTERGHRVLRLIGKGNKPATMPITIPILRALEASRGERTTGFLLTTLDGRQLERHAAAGLVRTIARHAKIDRHVSPHMLRRSAITAALDAGCPLRDVQNLARHEDPRTTSRYDLARRSLDRHAVHILSAYVAT